MVSEFISGTIFIGYDRTSVFLVAVDALICYNTKRCYHNGRRLTLCGGTVTLR